VILDLKAVWCHWCHVMEETTYRDARVIALLDEHFVCLEVDQDARPDLSARYEDYGWPATILFDARGRELAKRSGYVEPDDMAAMLAAFVADPTPGPSAPAAAPSAAVSIGSALGPELLAELEQLHVERYDAERGGFGRTHKFIDPLSVEYCIARALEGDADSERRARQTLDAALALIDPAWAASTSTRSAAIGRSRTSRRSCPSRPRTCACTRWPTPPGTTRATCARRATSSASWRAS
jgi:uncharacterized protein YyaL (SSP411 family)